VKSRPENERMIRTIKAAMQMACDSIACPK
jgi:hypothetical protein